MKRIFYSLLLLTSLYACGKKDKFECDVQNQEPPADDSGRVFAPNAFSPNGDGINDLFRPFYINVKSIDLKVYDIHNNLLFQTTDLAKGWAGNNDEKGVKLYYFKLDAITNMGNNISKCGPLFSYKCLPDDFDCSQLIFGDQFDPSMPEGYLRGSTAENFLLCNP